MHHVQIATDSFVGSNTSTGKQKIIITTIMRVSVLDLTLGDIQMFNFVQVLHTLFLLWQV